MKPQPVNIGGIECDALIHHELSLEMEIPDYPVEEGFSVQDTMIQKPKTLSLTVIVTNTPITFRSHASPGRVQQVASRFQELYAKRELITVTSAKGIFKNMGVTSLSLPYDVSTKTSLEIPITLKEVQTTAAKTVTIPSEYGRGGDTGTTAGAIWQSGRGKLKYCRKFDFGQQSIARRKQRKYFMEYKRKSCGIYEEIDYDYRNSSAGIQ